MVMNNYLKTGVLLAVLTAILVFVGYVIGGNNGAVFFFLVSLILNFVTLWYSDSIALRMARATILEETQAQNIFLDIRELSYGMGIPMPRVFVSPEEQPNAFATGRSPSHSAICVTQGLLKLLDRNQIRAVLAHELGHIKNRDTLLATIASVFAGTISSLGHILMFKDSEDRGGASQLLTIILAPIAAGLIQLAISRSREYAADETGARISHQAEDLAQALIKIDGAIRGTPMRVTNPALSSLFIENPFKGSKVREIFSTHPSTENRVKKLRSMIL